MRIAGFVIFGLLALAVYALPANAQSDTSNQQRVFGSANCQQKFSCADTDNATLNSLAKSCVSSGMGLNTPFDGASLDSSNCLSVTNGEESGKHSSTVQCCVVPNQDNTCHMRCSFLAN